MEHKSSSGRKARTPAGMEGEASPKLPEIAVCPECGSSYRSGRWTWETAPVGSYEHVCPACERIAAGYPAGVLGVEGAFAREHRDELVGLIRNVEERERGTHPLKRIMAIEDTDVGFEVATTDGKLALAFGRALHKAWKGELEEPPTSEDKENLVRVHWRRG